MKSIASLIKTKLYCMTHDPMRKYRNYAISDDIAVAFVDWKRTYRWSDITSKLIEEEWDMFSQFMGAKCATLIELPEFLDILRAYESPRIREEVDKEAGMHVIHFQYDGEPCIATYIPSGRTTVVCLSMEDYTLFKDHCGDMEYKSAYMGADKDGTVVLGYGEDCTYEHICRAAMRNEFIEWLFGNTSIGDKIRCGGECGKQLISVGLPDVIDMPPYHPMFRRYLLFGVFVDDWVEAYRKCCPQIVDVITNYPHIGALLKSDVDMNKKWQLLVDTLKSIDSNLAIKVDNELSERMGDT